VPLSGDVFYHLDLLFVARLDAVAKRLARRDLSSHAFRRLHLPGMEQVAATTQPARGEQP